MYEGRAGSSDQGVPLQLPPDAQKLLFTASFDIYRSVQQKEIIINQTDYQADTLHVDTANLEKLVIENSVSRIFQESKKDIPAQAQLYDRTANWEVYATPEKIILTSKDYHSGKLVLTFDDLRILRGISQPR